MPPGNSKAARIRDRQTHGDCMMPNEQQARETADFARKRILVTGGTKGVGAAIVKRLASDGATVFTTARSAGDSSDHFIQADVSTREGADRVIKTTLDRLGGLDILVNSVGGSTAPGGTPTISFF